MEHATLIGLRRELHRHPEPGLLEFGTAARIERALEGLPITVSSGRKVQDLSGLVNPPDPQTRDHWAQAAVEAGADAERVDFFLREGTALVAEVIGNRPGPTWALRVDIDALPIREADDDQHLPAREGFNSTNGVMHACGHDGHTAIGIALLHRLADHDFPGVLRVFFQPAEEGVRGAQTMIDAGVLNGVDRMLGLHLRGGSPVSTVIGSVTGGMAVRQLAVTFHGRASHASAAPQNGRNALLAAAMASLGIMSLPRFTGTDTRLNVGTLHAGGSSNIVPALAELTCEARADDDEVVEDLTDRVRGVIAGATAAYGVDHEIGVTGSAVTINPDEELIAEVLAAARTLDPIPELVPNRRLMGSDDVNLMIKEVQQAGGLGAYVNVGADSPAPHHSPYFDPDERAILTAVELLDRLFRLG